MAYTRRIPFPQWDLCTPFDFRTTFAPGLAIFYKYRLALPLILFTVLKAVSPPLFLLTGKDLAACRGP